MFIIHRYTNTVMKCRLSPRYFFLLANSMLEKIKEESTAYESNIQKKMSNKNVKYECVQSSGSSECWYYFMNQVHGIYEEKKPFSLQQKAGNRIEKSVISISQQHPLAYVGMENVSHSYFASHLYKYISNHNQIFHQWLLPSITHFATWNIAYTLSDQQKDFIIMALSEFLPWFLENRYMNGT